MTVINPPTPDLTSDWLIALLRSNWLFLAKTAAVCGVIGVIYAVLSPEEYTAETRLMPELQARSAANLKRFGALAELAGINLDAVGTTEAVRPDLYPDVLGSTPFLLDVLNKPVTTVDKTRYPTLTALLTDPSRQPLTAWLFNKAIVMPQPKEPTTAVRLNREQDDLRKDCQERILSDLDKQTGLIIVRVKMPDAEVAAQVCLYATTYLRRYVVRYRTEKARADSGFLAQRRSEVKQRYDRALGNLSAYADQNQYLYTQSAKLEGRRLEAEVSLTQTLYDELSRQYEQMRLKVQEETPILSVLEPPAVPARRSEPRRTLTVLVFAGIGLLAGAGWVLVRSIMSS